MLNPARSLIVAFLLAAAFASEGRAQDAAPAELSLQEEQAIRAAVNKVAPSVVRIETVGGLERVGQVRFGAGPTTGLVVSPDGFVISSAFNFAQKPSQILVTLAGGKRHPARLVATDHSRSLTLLKIEPEGSLPMPEATPADQMRVGGYAIALGRTYEGDKPNISVGIISALGRIYGKAIQTDAKVSPVNYGGPLCDIQGRVLGILAPMSPQQGGELAGVEWYDSGIGFAVPLEGVLKMLPRLSKGEDLHAGLLGVSLPRGNEFSTPPSIPGLHPGSPAAKAGVKVNDVIVEVDGQPVASIAQLKHKISNRYAGEEVSLTVKRGDQKLPIKCVLAPKLEPYQHAFLGVLPERSPLEAVAGARVRYVYPESPAAAAGLKPGDVLTGVGGQAGATADALRDGLNNLQPGDKTTVAVKRGDETLQLEVTLAVLPNDLPGELPAARAPRPAPAAAAVEVGVTRPKLAEFENTAVAYVPKAYDPAIAYGVVVWLHAPGGFNEEELLNRWMPLCDANDLILLAPQSKDPQKWLPTELNYLGKLLADVRKRYTIDASRIVAHGHQAGGSLAFALAFQQRDAIRAVAAVEAPLAGQMTPLDPLHRLAVYVAVAEQGQAFEGVKASVARLRENKVPVAAVSLGSDSRYLNPAELAALLRWIDSLDRL